MIQQIILLLINQLNNYLVSFDPAGTTRSVVVGNIGLATALGGQETYMDETIVASVVNIMEESTLKNSSPYRPLTLNPEIEHPPTYVNVYLLFSANFNPAGSIDPGPEGANYFTGLTQLSRVIEFFQGKRFFTIQNSPIADLLPETLSNTDDPPPELQDVCINMELVSLTFEQVNYLWGSLGGKQLPFVMYKAYVIPIKRTNVLSRGGTIVDVQSTYHHLNPVD